jgi:hypothetical protein
MSNLFDNKRIIFVFASNLAGRHGKGSAKEALDKWGAIYGQGSGLQGNSYAIATKDEKLNIRSLGDIYEDVVMFISFANKHPEMEFHVVKIGCGLAGYKEDDIQPMFENNKPLPENIILPSGW